MIRRHGNIVAFWGVDTITAPVYPALYATNVPSPENTGAYSTVSGTAIGAGISRPVFIGQASDQFILYVNVTAPTLITVQVAPQLISPDDIGTDDATPSNWYNLYWQATAMTLNFTGAASTAMIIPDFAPGWVRLTSSNNVWAIAGYEVSVP